MTSIRCKQAKDENFPVGKLISSKLRPLVHAYYQAARCADDIADNPELMPENKLKALDDAEAAFYGRPEKAEICPEAYDLGKLFQKENLDYRLYTDLLTAFRRDAQNQKIEIWEQLLDYCRYSAAPVGRFMLAIHDESPSTYMPAETLCAVLQIVNHLQDLKYDALQGRFYLPEQMMAEYGVKNTDLFLTESSENLRQLTAEICRRLRAMLQDAAILPSIIRSKRLKAELGIIFSLTNSMLKRIEKYDVLSTEVKLSKSDWAKAFCLGIPSGLLRKTKIYGRIR